MAIGLQADERHALHAVVVIVVIGAIVIMITIHIRPGRIIHLEVVEAAKVAVEASSRVGHEEVLQFFIHLLKSRRSHQSVKHLRTE